ncbi:lipopolysaccharide biosynthesis protein [Turicibacter sp. TS3]|uniref:lipopolysaccharide biosynthesis protein n=1 Tax=Turicibacter sp. TS3 TaxID=2304578 RepID=UPI00137A3FD7|nr:lipopolysaccharide biosynthesis protein [Turicibacter sp. TS3]NCE77817.1 lipopolysaccharide biosynthesis protein [Turicibacter sp. TS3]
MEEAISIKKATVINFVSRYSNVFIQLLINSVLARLLTPDDYGVVTVITVFTGFFTLIADMGIGPAIIQDKSLKKEDISSIFNFTVITGIGISVMFLIFSYPLSWFYNNHIYISLGAILSLSILFNVLNIVPNALLLKEKKFKLIGVRTVCVSLVSGLITIILAYFHFKYYAIVINSILIAFFTFFLNYKSVDIKLRWILKKESLIKISSYSVYQFGFSFINYFARNLDNLLIGKILGEIPLGYYDKAYKLMLYPVSNLTNVISPVLHPILSEYQNKRDFIYEKYIYIVRLLSILGVFFTIFCFVTAREIILIMFGNQWINSIWAFKLLSLSIWAQMVTSSSGAIFQSTGETKWLFRCGIFTTINTIVCILIGLRLGSIETVALFVASAFLMNFIIVYFILVKKVFMKKLHCFILELKNHVIIASIMILGYYLIPVSSSSIFLSTIYKFIIGAIFFLGGVFITKEYKKLLNKVSV